MLNAGIEQWLATGTKCIWICQSDLKSTQTTSCWEIYGSKLQIIVLQLILLYVYQQLVSLIYFMSTVVLKIAMLK